MHTESSRQSDPRYGFYAVKVRSLAEESVAGTLRTKGFDVLAPTYIERRQYSDRIRKANKALFPGYVFVRMDAQELMPVVSTQGVSYIVKTGSTIAPLPPEEEITISLLSRMETACEPCASLQPGQRVRIETGPLAGQEGVLVRMDGNDRVVLSVNSIFQSVSVDVRNTQLTVLAS